MVLLNQTAAYGLRAMSTLASLEPGESLNAAELSRRTGVPKQYLSKIMRKLVVGRLVHGRKGHGGGFSLLRPARQISLEQVLVALDIDIETGCVFGYAACDDENPCPLHPVWSRLKGSLERWARAHSLADIEPVPDP